MNTIVKHLLDSTLRQLDAVVVVVGLQLGHVPLEHKDIPNR